MAMVARHNEYMTIKLYFEKSRAKYLTYKVMQGWPNRVAQIVVAIQLNGSSQPIMPPSRLYADRDDAGHGHCRNGNMNLITD
jgi:hypothetical protein